MSSDKLEFMSIIKALYQHRDAINDIINKLRDALQEKQSKELETAIIERDCALAERDLLRAGLTSFNDLTASKFDVYAALNVLRDKALRIAIDHGFKNTLPAEDMALIHSEVSEALEDIRNNKGMTQIWYEKDEDGNDKPCGIPIEMADTIIRVLHFCGKHNIDIRTAVLEKMTYNDTRPYLHGKKF